VPGASKLQFVAVLGHLLAKLLEADERTGPDDPNDPVEGDVKRVIVLGLCCVPQQVVEPIETLPALLEDPLKDLPELVRGSTTNLWSHD
jgi:hypothetical protein